MNKKSQEPAKLKLFSQETNNSQHLRYDTLFIADYNYAKISVLFVGYKAMTERRC